RVSIHTPVNSRVSAPATIVPTMAVATQSAVSRISGVCGTALRDARIGPAAGQRLARHGDIVERQRAVADHLILLVPFARDEHQIAGPRELDRPSNRRQAIDDRQQALSAVPLRVGRDAALDLLDDELRILTARV